MTAYWFVKLAEVIEARIAEDDARYARERGPDSDSAFVKIEVLREVAAALRKVAAS
jgi:hypothetical protein